MRHRQPSDRSAEGSLQLAAVDRLDNLELTESLARVVWCKLLREANSQDISRNVPPDDG